mgnify:CR=1 FL=1
MNIVELLEAYHLFENFKSAQAEFSQVADGNEVDQVIHQHSCLNQTVAESMYN